MKPDYWKKATKELSAKDKTLALIISSYKGESLKSQAKPFYTLAKTIIGQQISVKAADAIWQRFAKLFPKKNISYKNFLKINTKDLKAAGLSKQKIEYLGNIAHYFKENKIDTKYFQKTPKEKIHQELLAIKGIGKWSLEMFQIFYLLEPDVFPIADLGLIKAIKQNYKKAKLDSKEDILKFSKRWTPYRTVVTWYLWRTFDEEPVHY